MFLPAGNVGKIFPDPLPLLRGDVVEKTAARYCRLRNVQLFQGQLVCIGDVTLHVCFTDHLRQQVDQVLKAALACAVFFRSFTDLLFKELSIVKKIDHKQDGEHEQQQNNEDITQGIKNPDILFSPQGTDKSALIENIG